ncbi:MAG: cytidine deaminase [Pseudomonadota bacterium]
MSDDLIKAAAAAETTYSPYSGFAVGAAVRTPSGAICAGCNIENASYPQGLCAEPSALSAMIMAGERRIVEVCVWTDSARTCAPFSGRRRKLAGFGAADTIVVSACPDAERGCWTFGDLLPEAFSLEVEE